MPNTVSSSWRNCVTFSVRLPEQDVDDLAGAEPLAALAVAAGSTVDSSFCAATVPSHDSGGVRQVSQLPHGARVL